MQWTSDCTKALASTKERGDKKALKSLKKKQVSKKCYCINLIILILVLNFHFALQISMLNKFSEMIRGNLTKIQRQKIVALVTIEVHARDVIEKMIKSGCGDVTAFEWLSQLRLYWDKVCLQLDTIPNLDQCCTVSSQE